MPSVAAGMSWILSRPDYVGTAGMMNFEEDDAFKLRVFVEMVYDEIQGPAEFMELLKTEHLWKTVVSSLMYLPREIHTSCTWRSTWTSK